MKSTKKTYFKMFVLYETPAGYAIFKVSYIYFAINSLWIHGLWLCFTTHVIKHVLELFLIFSVYFCWISFFKRKCYKNFHFFCSFWIRKNWRKSIICIWNLRRPRKPIKCKLFMGKYFIALDSKLAEKSTTMKHMHVTLVPFAGLQSMFGKVLRDFVADYFQ